MKKLYESFRENLGLRGVHLYSHSECRFLVWTEVLSFLKKLPKNLDPDIEETLLSAMSNYDPDSQFLAIRQKKESISIELYSPVEL